MERRVIEFEEFLVLVIEDGIEAARHDYPLPRQRLKLDGANRGFEDCRGRNINALCELLKEARDTVRQKRKQDASDFWYWRCREAEIYWVCNVLSAALYSSRVSPIVPPTAAGALKASEILGVKDA